MMSTIKHEEFYIKVKQGNFADWIPVTEAISTRREAEIQQKWIDETRPFPDWKSRIDNYPDADYSDCR